jgi:flagellar basal body-associated protein FliL
MFDDEEYRNEYNQGGSDKQFQDSMTIIIVMLISLSVLIVFAALFWVSQYIGLNYFYFDICKAIQ